MAYHESGLVAALHFLDFFVDLRQSLVERGKVVLEEVATRLLSLFFQEITARNGHLVFLG